MFEYDDRGRSEPVQSLRDAALSHNHPDPDNARWGEVNILSLASMRAGREPTKEEAQEILDWAERMSDFNETMRGGD